MKKRVLMLIIISICIGLSSQLLALTALQSLIISIFSFSIFGSLFFWHFRQGFAFIGSALFLTIGAVGLEDFIRFASLDVILFLLSMMIIVGMMKESGFFEWLLTLLLRINHLTGIRLFVILMLVSAVFSAVMGEVASIIVVMAIILNLSDFLEIEPLPLVISSVIATNIGSAATVLGNPVGVLIAARSNLSFEDFILHAFPVSAVVLGASIVLMCLWYAAYIRDVSDKLQDYVEDKSFLYLISIPPDRETTVSIGIFLTTIVLIGFHRRLEILLNLEHNTMLITLPFLSAGIVLLYRHDKARHYIEHEIEWNSLLFFLFLFAQAGVVHSSGVAAVIAKKFVAAIGHHEMVLTGSVLLLSGLLSSILDNVVAVAAYIPIIQSMDVIGLEQQRLWWALLFGACFGGNVTMIGSTANIVALGILEKQKNLTVLFRDWLKLGIVIGLVSTAISFIMLTFF